MNPPAAQSPRADQPSVPAVADVREPAVDHQATEAADADESSSAEAVDRFGRPLDPIAFLHSMIGTNWPESVRLGRMNPYGVDTDMLLDSLPDDARRRASGREQELWDLLDERIRGARELEAEHWRLRARDLHAAIDAGSYVVVEFDPGLPDKEKAMRIAAAKQALNLGVNPRDYLEIVSSARPSSPELQASAFIYCRRADYPDSFVLLDEVRELRLDAQEEMCRWIGASLAACGKVWYW
jgi:hypothetical protein